MRNLLSLPQAWGAVLVTFTLVACGDDDPSDPAGGGGEGAGTTTTTTTAAVTTSVASSSSTGRDEQVAEIQIEAQGVCNFNCFQMNVGIERQLVAHVLDDNGNELDIPVTWSSEDEAIVTVDDQGVAESFAEGEVTVSAMAGGVTGTAVLTVIPNNVVTVEITPQSTTLATVGATQQLTAVAKDEDGNVVPDAPIVWMSANPYVAAVDSVGLVTSTEQGHVVVQAGSGFATGWAEITVVSPLSPDPAWSLASVTGGGHHACGLTASGQGHCWGWNFFGQLGNGEILDEPENEPVAVPVTGGHTFSSLTAGLYHTCGLTSTGQAYCWGVSDTGQLGNGDDTVLGSPTALPVVGGHVFTELAAGGTHTCGITTTGALYCWGGNGSGQLGVGTTDNSWTPLHVAAGTTFEHVVAGLWNVCALTTTGVTHCWGDNFEGQLGNGSNDPYASTPVVVSGNHVFTTLDTYGSFICGIDDAGALWCWGRNDTGQLGDGTLLNKNVPVAVTGTETYVDVATGAHHMCAITTGGVTRCWGDGAFGQLGDGSLEMASPVAHDVKGGLAFVSVEAGSHFTCGRTASSAMYCWGDSSRGQLGAGLGDPGHLSAVPMPMTAQ